MQLKFHPARGLLTLINHSTCAFLVYKVTRQVQWNFSLYVQWGTFEDPYNLSILKTPPKKYFTFIMALTPQSLSDYITH